MKQFLSFLFTFLSFTLASNAQNLQQHVVNVGDFTHLAVINSINVDYKSNPDSAGMAIFTTRPDKVNVIMFTNNNKGKLTIEIDTGDNFITDLPTITVYSRALSKIENLADSTVRAFSVNAGNKFKAKLEGNGRLALRKISAYEVGAKTFTGRGQIAIDGNCTKANLSCTGVGTIQADQLTAQDVTATINGTGNIGCNVSHELTVKGLGPGSLYYIGTPVKIKNYSVSVKIKEM